MAILLMTIPIFGQFTTATPMGYPAIKAKDIANLSNRTLVVVLEEKLTEEEKARILKNDKKKGESRIVEKDEATENYNSFIFQAFKQQWSFNDEIKTMTEEEVKEIRLEKTQNKEYLFAYFKTYPWSGMSLFDAAPMLCLQRSEQKTTNPDFSVCIPGTPVKKIKEMTILEFSLAVYILEQQIKYVQSSGFQYTYEKMIRDLGKKNCGKISNQTILVDKDNLAEGQTEDMFTDVGDVKVKLVDKKAIENAFLSKEAGVLLLFSVPFNYTEASGAMGYNLPTLNEISRFPSYKFLLNPETMEIYGSNGNGAMANKYATFKFVDIESILKCK